MAIEIRTETRPAIPAKPAQEMYSVRDGQYSVDWFATGGSIFPAVYHPDGQPVNAEDFDKFSAMFAEIARRLRENGNGK
jgi:hypothetical protein